MKLHRWIAVVGVAGGIACAGPAVAYVINGEGEGSTGSLDSEGYKVSCGGPYFLCGYVDINDKETVPRNFEMASPFFNGLARVRIDGRFGYIDRTGKTAIEPRYSAAGHFADGKAKVLVDGKVGLIDRNGKYLLEPRYSNIYLFGQDKALVAEEPCARNDYRQCGNLGSLRDDHGLGEPNSVPLRYKIVDLANGYVGQKSYVIRIFDGDNVLVWARAPDSDRFGLLRTDETWAVAPKYRTVNQLFDGAARVCLDLDQGHRSWAAKCGFVDLDGRELTLLVFERYVQSWLLNRVIARNGKQQGLFDANGDLMGGRYFDELRRSDAGDVLIARSGDDWMGVDRDGHIVAHPNDGKVESECPNGLKSIWQSGKIKLVGPEGRQTEPMLFEHSYQKLNCGGLTSVFIRPKGAYAQDSTGFGNNRWGFVDADGRLVGGEVKFENLQGAFGNRAVVQENGQWGVIDGSGRYTVPPQYDSFRSVGDGVFAVIRDGRTSWIDIEGMPRPEPNRADDRAKVLTCGGSDGAHFISREENGVTFWGLAAQDGTVIAPPKYRALRCYVNGVAWVADDSRRKWCQIDIKGEIRNEEDCSPHFNGVTIFDAGREQMADDPYESLVLWERALLDYGRGDRKDPPKIVSGTRF